MQEMDIASWTFYPESDGKPCSWEKDEPFLTEEEILEMLEALDEEAA